MTSTPVVLEIGTLALTGFSPAEGRRVLAGFHDELARAGIDGPPSPPADPVLTPAREVLPERIGAAAARALIEALGR